MPRLRLRLRERPIGTVLACLAIGACLGGCSARPTQRASLEYKPLVIEPSPEIANRTGSAFASSGRTRSITSVPTD